MKSAATVLGIALVTATLPRDAVAAELLMFEQVGCEWCEEWDAVIGPIYPLTAEGRLAPLRRVDIDDPVPSDIAHIRPGHFTPTFVLIHDGREIGRIRGYPGEDFFWALLGEMIGKLSDQLSASPTNDN